jgi:hypothetical protein
MFELFHPFEGTIINFFIVTSSCILISRYATYLVLSAFILAQACY